MKVLAEIMRDAVLRGVFMRSIHPTISVVDTPKINRNAFTDVAKHDLEPRAFIENSTAYEPQRVHRGLCSESPVGAEQDRKSTRLNSSHVEISYAVFCLKKKKKTNKSREQRKNKKKTKQK